MLDGADVDSGTAAEIGYAFARGKLIVGYRGDFRVSADNEGALVNLQVEFFIRESGGTIVSRYEDLGPCLLSLHPGTRAYTAEPAPLEGQETRMGAVLTGCVERRPWPCPALRWAHVALHSTWSRALASRGSADPAQDAPAHDLLNAVLWMQRSVEYKATALTAFALARIRLDQALADPSWTAAPRRSRPARTSPCRPR